MYVKLHVVDGKLVGTNDLGNPYNLDRLPLSPHVAITKAEFEAGAAKRKKEYPPITPPTA